MASNTAVSDINEIQPDFVTQCQLELQEIIGRGGSSDVFRATARTSDGKMWEVAAKKVRRLGQQEVNVMSQLNHKYIVKYLGAVPDDLKIDTVIIMEYAHGGDLFRYLRKSKAALPSTILWKWVYQAAAGIQYLHGKDIVHRDIKSPNYLIMDNDTLKLGDFGRAKELSNTTSTLTGGTGRWMAPEVIDVQKRSKKSDVYSYGIVIFELVSTEIPFKNIKIEIDVMNAVRDGKRPEIPTTCPDKLYRIMKKCWIGNYGQRPSMDEVIADIFDKCSRRSLASSPISDAASSALSSHSCKKEELPISSQPVQESDIYRVSQTDTSPGLNPNACSFQVPPVTTTESRKWSIGDNDSGLGSQTRACYGHKAMLSSVPVVTSSANTGTCSESASASHLNPQAKPFDGTYVPARVKPSAEEFQQVQDYQRCWPASLKSDLSLAKPQKISSELDDFLNAKWSAATGQTCDSWAEAFANQRADHNTTKFSSEAPKETSAAHCISLVTPSTDNKSPASLNPDATPFHTHQEARISPREKQDSETRSFDPKAKDTPVRPRWSDGYGPISPHASTAVQNITLQASSASAHSIQTSVFSMNPSASPFHFQQRQEGSVQQCNTIPKELLDDNIMSEETKNKHPDDKADTQLGKAEGSTCTVRDAYKAAQDTGHDKSTKLNPKAQPFQLKCSPSQTKELIKCMAGCSVNIEEEGIVYTHQPSASVPDINHPDTSQHTIRPAQMVQVADNSYRNQEVQRQHPESMVSDALQRQVEPNLQPSRPPPTSASSLYSSTTPSQIQQTLVPKSDSTAQPASAKVFSYADVAKRYSTHGRSAYKK